MGKKVVIAAGGTGGHLFPAQRIARSFQNEDIDVLFLGGGLDSTPFFERNNFPYRTVKAYPWRGLRPGQLWRLFQNNMLGIRQSIKVLRDYQPDAVIGFGSFHTLPVMVAAKMCGLPQFMYEANSIPGKVIRWFSRYADQVAAQFPNLQKRLGRNVLQVAMSGKFENAQFPVNRQQALAYFELGQERTVLVAGGSQGAEAINHAVKEAFLKGGLRWQIIHLLGRGIDPVPYRLSYQQAGIRSCVKNFEERMDYAWSVTDLFIGRAGAGTIAEIIQTATPSILIPYPHASEDHQSFNADFLVDLGGGMRILQSEPLVERIWNILNNPSLEQWKNALNNYKKQQTGPTLEEAAMQFLTGSKVTA